MKCDVKIADEERLHSISPWQHPMVRHAQDIGLGVTHRTDLTVTQKGVDNIDTLLEHMA